MSSMESLSPSGEDDRDRLSSSNSNSTADEGRPLFTPEERAILCGKAAEYFSNGHFTKVDVLYRNKPQQYFDAIRAKAEEMGNDEIMLGYNKNATGHQENGINWQLDGCFFATFTIAGQPSYWSPFGDTRLSVDADHLLAPNKTSLFFADFFCVRNSKYRKHMVILVACPQGSNAEQQCMENTLYKLDVLDNPFLRLNITTSSRFNTDPFMPAFINLSKNYYVAATANGDSINVFYAGDFNISEARRLGKCRFTKTETSDWGYVERRGLEVNEKCPICNVLPLAPPLPRAQPEAIDQQWRLWEFICRDMPRHACRQVNERATQQINIDFGREVEKICQQHVQLHMELPGVFSFYNWKEYLHKRDAIFENAEAMVECVEINEYLLPSLMLRFFDNNIGIALFRDGITPDYNCPYNRNGGYFQLRLLGRKNDDGFLRKMDALFCKFVHFIVLGLGPNMVKFVNGVFVRCEVDQSGYRAEDCANNFASIPILVKIEVWINDRNEQTEFSRVLDRWSQRELPNDARIFPPYGPPEHQGKFVPHNFDF